MYNDTTNSADHLDSRDLQERIDELEKLMAVDEQKPDGEKMTEIEHEELGALTNLKEQYVSDYGDSSWGFGAQFIRDSYFEDYARELADDIGAVNNVASWPSMYIDWEAATEALQMDYTEVVYDGVTYWTREA
jgi:antirestriction protein